MSSESFIHMKLVKNWTSRCNLAQRKKGIVFLRQFFWWLRNNHLTNIVVKGKNAFKCTSYFVWKSDVLEQSYFWHYFWNQHPKISKKQVLDFIQQIWWMVECILPKCLHKILKITYIILKYKFIDRQIDNVHRQIHLVRYKQFPLPRPFFDGLCLMISPWNSSTNHNVANGVREMFFSATTYAVGFWWSWLHRISH